MKLSRTSKLGCLSWSLQAKETCPGSVQKGGELVDACKGCYATTGCYHFPDTIAVRAHNKADWKRDGWVQDMVQALSKQKYFRWFDSGDMYSLDLAVKIYQVMLQTPNTKHWLPTRMHKFTKFGAIIGAMSLLDNVKVRRSSDSVTGEFEYGLHGSTIVPSASSAPDGVHVCPAYSQGGKCNGCRVCWDKLTPVVGYVAHGKKMAKVINLAKVA